MVSRSYYEGYEDREEGLSPFIESEYSGDYSDYWLGYNDANEYYVASSEDENWDDIGYYDDDDFDFVEDYDDKYDEGYYY